MRRKYPYRKWTARPARPMRYPPHQWLTDWFHGWRDGIHQVPELPSGATDDVDQIRRMVTTPRLEVLRCQAEDRRTREEETFCTLQEPLVGELKALLRTVEELRRKVDQAQADLDLACRPPAEEDLKERRTAETNRSDTLVRQRRLAEHARRRAQAERIHEEVRRRLEARLRRQAKIEQTLSYQKRAFQARERRLNEHAGRRIATYWQQLVRSHADGPQLNTYLRPIGPDLPRSGIGQGDD